MFWKEHAQAAQLAQHAPAAPVAASGTLTSEEISWLSTLDVGDKEDVASPSSSVWVTAPSSPAGSTWTTAPSSPEWAGLPPMPGFRTKEMKRQQRLVKNRQSAKVSRERKIAREKEMKAKVAEIEQVNQTLRAQIEYELERNGWLKESLGMEVDVDK